MTRMADHESHSATRELAPPASAGVLRFPPVAGLDLSGEALLEALHTRLEPQLSEFASAFVSADDADDIVQQAFVELWNRYIKEGRTPTASWESLLFESVNFRIGDFRRTRRRRSLALVAGGYARSLLGKVRVWMRPDWEFERESFNRVLDRAVDAMSPRAREIHVLHYRAGYTVSEIVDMLGVGRPTVKSMILRGNRVMREHLDRAGYSPVTRRALARRENPS